MLIFTTVSKQFTIPPIAVVWYKQVRNLQSDFQDARSRGATVTRNRRWFVAVYKSSGSLAGFHTG